MMQASQAQDRANTATQSAAEARHIHKERTAEHAKVEDQLRKST